MKNLITKLPLAAALTLAFASVGAPAHAADEPVAENTVAYNVAFVSDYRYRGLSQSRMKPALQGGVDYTHNPSGFYLGAWGSTIKWIKDFGGDASTEIDVYGGKRGEITSGLTYDVGGLYYFYPSNDLTPSANTFEVYGQVGYGPVYAKYSHSTTNLFGTANSKGSGYLDLGGNFDFIGGFILNLHAGRQMVKNNGVYSYNDYKVGLTKDLGVVTFGIAVVAGDTHAYTSPKNGKDLGQLGAVVTISKTF